MFSNESVLYRVMISIGGALVVLVGSFFLAALAPSSGFPGNLLFYFSSLFHFIPLLLAYNYGDSALYFAYLVEAAIIAAFLFYILTREKRKHIAKNKTQEP